jgi:hypothetical protein
MKNTLIIFAFLITFSAHAETFTLTSNQSGAQYQCYNGSNPLPPPSNSDPACVSKIADYCSQNTSYTNSQCFDKATQSCRGSAAKFADCLIQTAEYCERNTSFTGTQCFDRGLDACKGSAQAITELMEVSAKSLK